MLCIDKVKYCTGEDATDDQVCELCRHAGRLANRMKEGRSCPDWKIDPPAGDGWQMWETTSEGSPMSPVFETPEELAKWLADNNASAFGKETATYEQWLAAIRQGWTVGMVIDNKNGLRSGVEAAKE